MVNRLAVSLHSLGAEFHTGALVLASLALIGAFITRKQGSPLHKQLETVAFFAAMFGVLSLIFSAIVGWLIWPSGSLLFSPSVWRKIMFTVFSLTFWMLFLYIRFKFKSDLWKNTNLSAIYFLTGIGGILALIYTGTMGGKLTGKESILDAIVGLFGR